MGSKPAIGAIAAALLGLLLFALWVFALRDTWEQDNRYELKEACDSVVLLIQNGRIEEGVAEYEKIFAFVGDREIEDAELRRAILCAKQAGEPAQRRLERDRREAKELKSLRSLESQAEAFIQAGDLHAGIDKYQQALNLVQDAENGRPEFADVIRRITRARSAAQSRLDDAEREKRRRDAETAAENTRRAELARIEAANIARRAEEERVELANRAKGLVKIGGQWMTKEQALVWDFESRVKALLNLAKKPEYERNILRPRHNIERSESLTFPYQATLAFTTQWKKNANDYKEFLIKLGYGKGGWQVTSALVKDLDGIWRDHHWAGFLSLRTGTYGHDDTVALVVKAFSQ